jgi:thioredoxin-like negative regulator of GroEL
MSATTQVSGHAPVDGAGRPRLLVFGSARSGPSRRVEGFVAQVLQRRQNHSTFALSYVDLDAHAELADRLQVVRVPTILVIEGGRVRARIEQPRGAAEIRTALAQWLR